MCLPTLSASAPTKRYLTEGEKVEESTKTLSAAPLELHIYCIWLVLARMQVCLILTQIFSTIIWNSFSYTISNSQSSCDSEPWMTWSILFTVSHFCGWLELQEENMMWYLNMATICRKPKGYCELPLDTTCHCLQYLVCQETLTARLRLLWQEKQNTRQGIGGCICAVSPLEFWIREDNNLTSSSLSPQSLIKNMN